MNPMNPTGKSYEVPAEMRDFAEKSVEQARKAFESFMGAAHKAQGAVDGAASAMQTNAKTVGERAMTFAESNVNAAFELAQKLVRAKDLQEVMQLQADYARAQMANVQTQAREMGSILQTQAQAAGEAAKAQATNVAGDVMAAAQKATRK